MYEFRSESEFLGMNRPEHRDVDRTLAVGRRREMENEGRGNVQERKEKQMRRKGKGSRHRR